MNFKVFVTGNACELLPLPLQQKLARRAARKVLRMGRTSAIVIFPGPNNLRVTVNCMQSTIVIDLAKKQAIQPVNLIRKSA